MLMKLRSWSWASQRGCAAEVCHVDWGEPHMRASRFCRTDILFYSAASTSPSRVRQLRMSGRVTRTTTRAPRINTRLHAYQFTAVQRRAVVVPRTATLEQLTPKQIRTYTAQWTSALLVLFFASQDLLIAKWASIG